MAGGTAVDGGWVSVWCTACRYMDSVQFRPVHPMPEKLNGGVSFAFRRGLE